MCTHSEALPKTDDAPDHLCISYARDFISPALEIPLKGKLTSYTGTNDASTQVGEVIGDVHMTNVEGLYASKSVPKGEIVLTEEELPDCQLPESEEPNCQVVELVSIVSHM